MGLLLLEKGKNVVILEEVLYLNEMVFNKFEEFRNYIYLKNLKYERIKGIILDEKDSAFMKKN